MRGHPLGLIGTALLATCCGWGVSRVGLDIGSPVLWAACTLIVATLGVAAAKRVLERLQRLADAHVHEPARRERPHPTRHRGARWLYYAGLATMPLLALRFGGTTLSDYVFLGALVLAAIDVIADRFYRLPRFPGLLPLGLGLFVCGALIATVAHSTDPIGSAAVLARLLYLLTAWFVLGAIVLRTPQHVRTAVAWWVVGAALCGFYAAGQKAGVVPGGIDPSGRVAGLADHVNDLGALSAIAAVPALMLAYTTRNLAYGVCAVGIFVGLMLSGSIGAGVAILAALLVCSISPQLARVVVVAAVIGACGLAYASATDALDSTPIGRFEFATGADGTLAIRADTFNVAWERIQDDPLIGTGLDAESSQIYTYASGQSHAVHNLFLARWYESGLLGLLGIVLIVWVLLATGWQTVVQWRGADQLLAISLLAGTIAFVIVGMSEPLLYKRYALAPAGLAFALYALQDRRHMASRVPRRPDSGQLRVGTHAPDALG